MTDNAVTRYSTYFERYNDEALDPFSGDYGTLMATFRALVGREAAQRANQLYEQVFNNSELQPHVYLLLTQTCLLYTSDAADDLPCTPLLTRSLL